MRVNWPRVLSVAAIVLVLATAIKWSLNKLADRAPDSNPCSSTARARLARVYVYSAQVNPRIVTYHGQQITIREAWVERRNKIHHFLVWFPYRQDLGGYVLCFTISSGKEMFQGGIRPGTPFWVMDDLSHSFAERFMRSGRPVFYEHLDVLPSDVLVSLISSSTETRKKDIRIEIDSSGVNGGLNNEMPLPP